MTLATMAAAAVLSATGLPGPPPPAEDTEAQNPNPVYDKLAQIGSRFLSAIQIGLIGGAWGDAENSIKEFAVEKKVTGEVISDPSDDPVNWVWSKIYKAGESAFGYFPWREVVGMKTTTPISDEFGPLPPGDLVEEAFITTPHGGTFPLTITPRPDLDAPGALPTSLPDIGGPILFDWTNLDMIPADRRQGNYFLLSVDLPLSAVVPAPSAVGLLLAACITATRRRRSEASRAAPQARP